jgi:tetratricopeptide (TPR) repeat protein
MEYRDDIRPEVVVQDMIDQHAKDRSFYYTNIFTAQWMREKNKSQPEGFLWRMTDTKDLGYPLTSARLDQLWSTYRLRSLDAPERGYWDEYTDVMKDSYGIGYDFTGYFALMDKNPELALWGFNNALKYRQPQTLGRIYMMLGETYMMDCNFSAAVNNYQFSLKSDSKNPEIPYVLAKMGDAFRLMNDYSDADLAYHQAMNLNPQQPMAGNGLAILNNPSDAIKKYQDALKNETKTEQRGYLWMEMGEAYLVMKNPAEAKKALQEALRINPGNAEAQCVLRMLGYGNTNR